MCSCLSIKEEGDIEYIRTDAFIEKTAKLIEDNSRKWFANMRTHGVRITSLMIEDFKRKMKGE